MAFSSTTTPHATQMEAPDASWFSISVDPQLGQNDIFVKLMRRGVSMIYVCLMANGYRYYVDTSISDLL